MQPQPQHPPQLFPSPLPHPPSSHHARQTSVKTDLHTAFNLLRRSDAARRFILTPPTPSADLALLASPRPSFTIATEEDQLGSVPGRISLRYLGLPAFSNTEGMSGGLVVTTYTSRTHPLHDDNIMSNVRIGRYIRDNKTGEWCILTRNLTDGIVRLQSIRTTRDGERERIGLTCSTDLFDRGRFQDSVLFKCHDYEFRVCHRCACTCCLCHAPHAPRPRPQGLMGCARTVVQEGAGDWFGTVRVTVVSNLSKNPMLDIDDTMTVRSSYKPALDFDLALHMRQQAILETVAHSMRVQPSLVEDDATAERCDNKDGKASKSDRLPHDDLLDLDARLPPAELLSPVLNAMRTDSSPVQSATTSLPPTPDLTSVLSPLALSPVARAPQPETTPLPNIWSSSGLFFFDDEDGEGAGQEGVEEIADHFLIASEARSRAPLTQDEEAECAMLPADPSTLPAGVGGCMEGMEVDEDVDDDLDDDCFSLMTSERDGRSVSSALSTAGSDDAPPLDSVPPPGDDFIDAISALRLSGAGTAATEIEGGDGAKFANRNDSSMSPCLSPINAPLTGVAFGEAAATDCQRLDGGTACNRSISTDCTAMDVQMSAAAGTDDVAAAKAVSTTPTTKNASPVAPGSTPVAPVLAFAPAPAVTMVPGVPGAPGVATGFAPTCGPYGSAPRLAPRPSGMPPEQSALAWATPGWPGVSMGVGVNGLLVPANPLALTARLQLMEKQRKAEERKKKNRQAAHRSNLKKKDLMNSIKSKINKSRQRENELREAERRLKTENEALRQKVLTGGSSGNSSNSDKMAPGRPPAPHTSAATVS